MMKHAWLLLCVAALWLLPAAVAAEEEAGWGYELGNELMSPFCPGRALAECPSPNAADLRQWILDQEEAGVSREAVEEQLFARWGDQLRQSPRAEGVGLVAYVVPALAVLVGAAIVAFFLRRQAAARPAAAPPAAPAAGVDPELERLIDQELEAGS